MSTQEWSRDFTIQQTITAGLDEDIERIIYKVFDEFEKNEGPRFQIFTSVWQQTGLGLIWCGRDSFREMSQFTEELFLRMQKYAMSTLGQGRPNHPLVRYAAIYLLYSSYFKQPCRPRVKIRLVKDHLEDLLETISMARQESHWDVLYAWSKLFTSHAFHFVACEGQMGLEVALQMEQREVAEKSSFRSKEDYFHNKEFMMLMKKMDKAHSKYVSMKSNLASSKVKADSSLFLTDQTFPQTVRQVVQQVDKVKEEASNAVDSAIGSKRRGIKYKFYGGGEDASAEQVMEKREENEWTPVMSFSKRGKGGSRGRGRKKQGEGVNQTKRG